MAQFVFFELLDQVLYQSSPVCPKRMPDGKAPAIDIHFCPIKFKFLFHGKILTGESFIDLDEIDFLESEAGSIQSHFHGGRKAESPPHPAAPPRTPRAEHSRPPGSPLSGFFLRRATHSTPAPPT